MRRFNIEAATLAKVSKSLPVVVQRITPVGKEHASMVFTVGGGVDPKQLNEDRLSEALGHLYNHRVRVCTASLTKIFDGPKDVYRCFVALNKETVPYETASTSGWTNVSANLFADDGDNIWEVSGELDNRVLRRVTDEDLAGVLQERQSRNIATAVSAVDSQPKLVKHAAVMFFDQASEELTFGLAVGGNKAYVHNDKQPRLVNLESAAAVAIVPPDMDTPHFNGAPDVASASASTVLDYYKRLYGHNQEFYAKLKELVQQYLHV